jgi:uncharacterized glyoxalase superfamily protein PhnB
MGTVRIGDPARLQTSAISADDDESRMATMSRSEGEAPAIHFHACEGQRGARSRGRRLPGPNHARHGARRGDRALEERYVTMFKPEGYTSVSPYLMVPGAQPVIDFLTLVFDATELRRFDRPDGRVMHAEVRIADTVVMLADATPEFPAFPAWMHVYVPDVDDTYRRALAAGGTSVQEPTQREGDPDQRGGVADPAGNVWWISTQVG